MSSIFLHSPGLYNNAFVSNHYVHIFSITKLEFNNMNCVQYRSLKKTLADCPSFLQAVMNYPAASSGMLCSLCCRHSAFNTDSSQFFWIPAFAGMTPSPQAAGNTTKGIQQNRILQAFDHNQTLVEPRQMGVWPPESPITG